MTSKSTYDFRALLVNQSTRWLTACDRDWRANGGVSISHPILRVRCIAMVRAELRRRGASACLPVDIAWVTEYDATAKLSNSVRCF